MKATLDSVKQESVAAVRLSEQKIKYLHAKLMETKQELSDIKSSAMEVKERG